MDWGSFVPAGARAAATLAAAALCALVLCSCGSSKGSSPTSPAASTTPAPSSPATSASGSASGSGSGTASAADEAAIKGAYVDFFSGKTPASRKQALLQHGSQFSQVIAAQASSPLAQSTTASVSKVTVQSPDRATVVYTISLSGQAGLTDQTGYAVRESGTWQVAASTFCALLALEGSSPSACHEPSVTTVPS